MTARTRRAALALVTVGILGGYGVGRAHADTATSLYPAIVRCHEQLTEDSAAHVKLARYVRRSDGSLVLIYRCSTKGW